MSKSIEMNEGKSEQLAEGYRKKYKEQVEALESSLLSKVERIGAHQITQLGKQLDAFSTYKSICEQNGTLNSLGQLPRIAFDVIPAVMGQLPIAAIASVQAIESQKGIIHFKNIAAQTTKGNRTAGQVFTDPRTGEKTNVGFASNLAAEVVGTGDGAVKTFSTVLATKPARSQFLVVSVDGDDTVKGKDQGPEYQGDQSVGQIYGQGVHGTVNYTTGAISLTFTAAPLASAAVRVSFQQNLEAAPDIAKIESYWDSKEISAHAYALKSTVGMLQAYTLQKQYGESVMDEMAKDLIRAINQEVFGDLVRKLVSGAVGRTTFSKTPPSGVSFFEHKMTYMDKLYEADSVILGNAGRGQISTMVVGREHAALVASLPGFEKLSDGKSLGAHIFGRLNGVLYIRVPEDFLMGGAKNGIGLFKGDSPFDAACVYSPFMPLAVTSDMPELANPLVSQRAAATMAGVDILVPQYATKFDILT